MEKIQCKHEFIEVASELIGPGCCYDSSYPCTGCGNCGYWSGDIGYMRVTYRCRKCGIEITESHS